MNDVVVQEDEEPVADLQRHGVLGKPIVGIEVVTHDHRGQGALAAKPLPAPKAPTPAARARHNLTHLPPEDWCPFCRGARKANLPHRKVSRRTGREVPLLCGDYGHFRNQQDDDLASMLVLKLYPVGLFFACLISQKGLDLGVIKLVADFIKQAGLLKFVYRSDREPAILTMLESAVALSGREGAKANPYDGKDDGDRISELDPADIPKVEEVQEAVEESTPVQAVPEHTHTHTSRGTRQ